MGITHVSMNLLVKQVSDAVSALLPHIYDAVADLGGIFAIPAATFGINIGVATGSLATEWMSAVPLAIVQESFSGVQSAGRAAITAVVKYLTVELVNFAWDQMENSVI